VAGNLLDTLGRLTVTVLYLAVFGLAFGEAAFLLDLVVPGEVGLVVVGAAGQRRGATLPLLCILGALGALAGDSMSWLLGKKFGTRLVDRWDWTRRTMQPRLDKANDVLSSRGGVAIFAARWVGALRALVPLVAGTAGVRYRTVLLWDLPAAVGWATAMVCLGWYLGEPVTDAVDRFGGYLSLIVVGGLVAWYLVRRRRAANDASR
jgi:membrane-associated protein